jgi:hypothetical protein
MAGFAGKSNIFRTVSKAVQAAGLTDDLPGQEEAERASADYCIAK